jgi:acetylornithine deacetylase/succinyl-diaminopimelate desuccinylase-like protein
MALDKAWLQEFAKAERGAFEEVLEAFVEVPSISADPERKGDVERVAELGAATIRRFGGQAELHRVDGGSPVVLGGFEAGPGLPTVTIYNHLDVQPAAREAEGWKTEPFVFTKEGDRYHGRGTTDDKGPAVTALFGAPAARAAGVPVNVRFLWETEEEVGSPHFDATLRKIGAAAAADVVVVSDTEWLSRDRPALSAGLRGLVRLIFTLATAE